MLALLLRLRLRLWWYSATRGANAHPWQLLLIPLFALILGPILISVSAGTVRALERRDPALADAFLPPLFVSLVVLVLLTGAGTIIQRLYLASDMDLLLAAPARLVVLFALKLVEVSATALLPVAALLAAIVGYGLERDVSFGFYLVAAPVLLITLVAATALSMVVVMLVVRAVPAGRVQAATSVLIAVIGAAVWLLFQTGSTPRIGGATAGADAALDQYSSATGWLPTTWAARVLTSVNAADWPAAGGYLILTGIATVATVGVAWFVFQRTFYVGQGRVREVRARRPRAAGGRSRSLRPPGMPLPVWALTVKDWRTITRDIRSLTGLIFPLVMGAFYTYQIVRRGDSSEIAVWLPLLGIPLMLFLGGSALPLQALGREGRGYALLKMSPLTAGQVLAAKCVANALPLTIVAWLATLATALWDRAAVARTLLLLVACAWYVGGAAVTNVAASAISASFDAENPQKSVGCLGQFYAAAVTASFLGASAGLFACVTLFGAGTRPDRWIVAAAIAAVLIVAVAAAIGVIGGLVRLGVRRLEEWQVAA